MTDMNAIARVFESHDENMVVALVDSGIDLSARDEHGNTVLHYAAIYGMQKAAEKIIDAGAKALVFNNAGERPLDFARAFGYHKLMHKIWAQQDCEAMWDKEPLPFKSLDEIRAAKAPGGGNHLEYLIRAGKMKQVIDIARNDPKGFTADDFLARGRSNQTVLMTLCAEEGFSLLFDRALWQKNPQVFAAILQAAPYSEKKALNAESFMVSLHQAGIKSRAIPRLSQPKP